MNTQSDGLIDDVEVAEVMTILTALDRWLQVTDTQVGVWRQALIASHPKMAFTPVRREDAGEAAVRLVTMREKADATPGLLIGEVVRLREERRKAVAEDALVPPDMLAPGRYPQWLRVARRHIGDGRTVEYALAAADVEMGASRRLLGPATAHTIDESLAGESA